MQYTLYSLMKKHEHFMLMFSKGFWYFGAIENYRTVTFEYDLMILFMIRYDRIWCISSKIMFKLICMQSKPRSCGNIQNTLKYEEQLFKKMKRIDTYFNIVDIYLMKWCAAKPQNCMHVVSFMSRTRFWCQNWNILQVCTLSWF